MGDSKIPVLSPELDEAIPRSESTTTKLGDMNTTTSTIGRRVRAAVLSSAHGAAGLQLVKSIASFSAVVRVVEDEAFKPVQIEDQRLHRSIQPVTP